MKKIIFLCLIIALVGCSKKASQTDSVMVNEGQTNNGDDILNSGEEKLKYGGIVYNSIINDDNVNVRAQPSVKADILFRVHKDEKIIIIGTSKEIDTIDGYTGNWLNIVKNQYDETGWVFSKYVEDGRITTTELKIIEILPEEEYRSQRLIASYQINGVERLFPLYGPHKEESQDFYTFAYDYGRESYHYSNIPGSYAWYPKTNELKHISYIGTDWESAWVIFTDDFKYVIEDFGTGPPPRSFGVWRVEDSKMIFSGAYYRNINLKGYTINVIYEYSDWNISNNRLDDEILGYAKKYEEDNPIPDDILSSSREHKLGIELIIICEFNLDTGIRKIINGRYINTQ